MRVSLSFAGASFLLPIMSSALVRPGRGYSRIVGVGPLAVSPVNATWCMAPLARGVPPSERNNTRRGHAIDGAVSGRCLCTHSSTQTFKHTYTGEQQSILWQCFHSRRIRKYFDQTKSNEMVSYESNEKYV